jgi:hypothetical protein
MDLILELVLEPKPKSLFLQELNPESDKERGGLLPRKYAKHSLGPRILAVPHRVLGMQ